MFFITLHGHIVKLVTASNFTRILTNENVSPDSSCSCRTLVLCTTMLKSFPRPSFLDCTRGSVKPLNRKVQFSSKKLFDVLKNSQHYHFMILWFNDAIFNLKCKTKGNWERAEFKNSHELFARLGRVFWACSHFILFQWMKILSKYFAGFDLGVLRNADLNWFISAEEQKWRRPPSKRTFIEVCFQGFSWLRFFCSKYFREAALSEGTIACQQWRRQR